MIGGYYQSVQGLNLPGGFDFYADPSRNVITENGKVASLVDTASGFTGAASGAAMPSLVQVSGFPALEFSGSQVLDFGDVLDIRTQGRTNIAFIKMTGSSTLAAKGADAGSYRLFQQSTTHAYAYTEGNLASNNQIAYGTWQTYSHAIDAVAGSQMLWVDKSVPAGGNIPAGIDYNNAGPFWLGGRVVNGTVFGMTGQMLAYVSWPFVLTQQQVYQAFDHFKQKFKV